MPKSAPPKKPKPSTRSPSPATASPLRASTARPVGAPQPPQQPPLTSKGSPRMTTPSPTLAPGGHPQANGHTPPPQPATHAAQPTHGAAPAPAATPTVSAVFGEIAWLMTQSTLHKSMFLSDLEWLVMPPLMLGQFRLFHGPDPLQPKNQRPIGCIFWALATPEVTERLATGITRMRPTDWRPTGLGGHGDDAARNSDAVVWIVDCLAPFGGTDQMIQDFKEKVFPGREVKWRSVGEKAKAAC
jgi:cytolysin-activating lysine-acyltransferase